MTQSSPSPLTPHTLAHFTRYPYEYNINEIRDMIYKTPFNELTEEWFSDNKLDAVTLLGVATGANYCHYPDYYDDEVDFNIIVKGVGILYRMRLMNLLQKMDEILLRQIDAMTTWMTTIDYEYIRYKGVSHEVDGNEEFFKAVRKICDGDDNFQFHLLDHEYHTSGTFDEEYAVWVLDNFSEEYYNCENHHDEMEPIIMKIYGDDVDTYDKFVLCKKVVRVLAVGLFTLLQGGGELV